jgi:phosphohistidine phosphatase
MKLYLVRHAIAEDPSQSGDDAERALTESGRAKMTRVTTGLRKLKVSPPLVLTSPLRRARETAEILVEGLGGTLEVTADLAPGVEPQVIAKLLHRHARLDSLVMVGHQPGLGRIASFLLTGSERRCELDFKKGGAACLELEPDSAASSCTLTWLLPPRILRSI